MKHSGGKNKIQRFLSGPGVGGGGGGKTVFQDLCSTCKKLGVVDPQFQIPHQ